MSLLQAWGAVQNSQDEGSGAAWGAVTDALQRLARGVTANPSLADELVSSVCLSLVRRAATGQLPAFDDVRLVRGYLKASLEKVFASHLRSQAREREASASADTTASAPDAESTLLDATAEARREDRARQRLAHTHRLVESLARAAIEARLPRYREEARVTWAELKAVHLEHRDLDDVIRAAEGPLAGPDLKRARLRRYQSFRRFRERMLELARDRHARGELTELDVRSVTALIGLELMSFQLSSPPRRRDLTSKSGA